MVNISSGGFSAGGGVHRHTMLAQDDSIEAGGAGGDESPIPWTFGDSPNNSPPVRPAAPAQPPPRARARDAAHAHLTCNLQHPCVRPPRS